MNGVALLLAAASLAVDYSWEKSAAGQVEYMVRVEAEVIPSLVTGEEIHSDVPAEAGTVERFRLRVGVDGNQPVFTPAAPGRFGVAADKSAMLVKSGAAAVETQLVSFGWQPNTDGKLMYYVQIDPALLRTLEVGDEIQAAVDTSAGPVATFVVFGGNKQLPRIPTGGAGVGATTTAGGPPSRFSPDADTSPAAGSLGTGSRFGGFDNGAAPAAATSPEPGPSRFGGSTAGTTAGSTNTGAAGTTGGTPPSRFGGQNSNDTATTPPGSRFGASGNTTNPPPYTGAGSNNTSTFNDSRPGAFNPPALETQSPPAGSFGSGNTGRNSSTFSQPPPSTNSDLFPANSQNGGYRNPPAQDPPSRNYDNRPTLDPPQGTSANRPLPPAGTANAPQNPPGNVAGQQPPPNAPVGNDRTAMVDPNTTRGAGAFSNQQPAAAPPAATTTEAEKPWWWGWLVFFFCVMCLSIGGNLYLGWTAVEFYHRYQRAVERLRSGTTAARA